MIKRILLSAIIAATALVQVRASLPMVDNTRPDRLVKVGVHIGAGISSFSQNYTNVVPDMSNLNVNPGFRMSVGFTGQLFIRRFISIGTGLDFNINNSRYACTLVDAPVGSLTSIFNHNRYYDFQVPVYVAVNFNLGEHVKWDVEGGVFFGKGVGGNSTADYYRSSLNSLGQPVVVQDEYKTKYFKDNNALINGVDDFDFGFHLATGMTFAEHYSFKFVCRPGTRNLAINQGVLHASYRSMALDLRLGYTF